ncbi:MAG: GNAT family N-acetyltransferase [Flavobacteriales bacterium]|nr:GNAT family N-acetyltransferase [Flavobacteriales bacterium]
MPAFVLRPFRSVDLVALVKQANDASIAAFLSDAFPHPYTEEHGRAFITECEQRLPFRRAIDINGEVCGAIGLHPRQDLWQRNMEIGFWLGREHRGHGIMAEAIKQMVVLGFAEFPEVTRIFGTTFGTNIASQRTLEKAGFKLEAKLEGTLIKNGRVEDEWIYAVRRR